MSYHFFAMFLGFVLDLLFGDPHWLPHPIRLIGNLIASLEKLNKKELSDTKKFLRGFVMVVIVIACQLVWPPLSLRGHTGCIRRLAVPWKPL